jgi:hypothetical protein
MLPPAKTVGHSIEAAAATSSAGRRWKSVDLLGRVEQRR